MSLYIYLVCRLIISAQACISHFSAATINNHVFRQSQSIHKQLLNEEDFIKSPLCFKGIIGNSKSYLFTQFN